MDEINQRVKTILQEEGLSAAGFADRTGVGRSLLSHITAGRNRPGLEVLQKILRAFPHISADWLLLGEGSMYRNPGNAETVARGEVSASGAQAQPTGRQEPPPSLEEKAAPGVETGFPHPGRTSPERESPAYSAHGQAAEQAAGSSAGGDGSAAASPSANAANGNAAAVERIVVFYKDGTFELYRPRLAL